MTTTTFATFATGRVSGIAFDAAGDIYASDSTGGRVMKLDHATYDAGSREPRSSDVRTAARTCAHDNGRTHGARRVCAATETLANGPGWLFHDQSGIHGDGESDRHGAAPASKLNPEHI